MRRMLLPLGSATLWFLFGVVNLTLADTTTYVYKGQWGGKGTGNGQFEYGISVATGPSGYVYVTDSANSRIQYFAPAGSFLGKWGSEGTGDGQFRAASSLAVNSEGNVYINDKNNFRIQYFASSGSFLGKWGSKGTSPGEFNSLAGLAVSFDTGRVYVMDSYWEGELGHHQRIQYFTKTGSYLDGWEFPTSQGDRGYHGMCLGPEDSVYVTVELPPPGMSMVTYYTPTGSKLGGWGAKGGGHGQFLNPGAIHYSSFTDYIYVADNKPPRIQVFTTTGSYITEWGTEGSGNGQFLNAGAITAQLLAPEVYVCDSPNYRIQYFVPDDAAPPTECGGCNSLTE
jgi:tripartite motif-containing protein 71